MAQSPSPSSIAELLAQIHDLLKQESHLDWQHRQMEHEIVKNLDPLLEVLDPTEIADILTRLRVAALPWVKQRDWATYAAFLLLTQRRKALENNLARFRNWVARPELKDSFKKRVQRAIEQKMPDWSGHDARMAEIETRLQDFDLTVEDFCEAQRWNGKRRKVEEKEAEETQPEVNQAWAYEEPLSPMLAFSRKSKNQAPGIQPQEEEATQLIPPEQEYAFRAPPPPPAMPIPAPLARAEFSQMSPLFLEEEQEQE